MQVVDTSVVVRAATSRDARERERLQDAIAGSRVPVAHVLAESYATLTSLPPPLRLTPRDCHAYLSSAFPEQPLGLSSQGYLRITGLLAEHGVTGGAIYDCLIAEAAREHGATLVSLDQRAAARYSLVGATHRLL